MSLTDRFPVHPIRELRHLAETPMSEMGEERLRFLTQLSPGSLLVVIGHAKNQTPPNTEVINTAAGALALSQEQTPRDVVLSAAGAVFPERF